MKESTVRIIIAGLLLVWCNICYSISSGDFEFSILSEEDKTVEVTLVEDYNKYVEELVFPNSVTIDGKLYKVISVGMMPITAGKYLYRVTLPDNIKRIADCAFGGSYLNRINIETDRLEK